MIEIGCNYIVNKDGKNIYDDLYKDLIKNNYINVLKFPGKFCNKEELENCLKLAKENNIKVE